MFNKDAYLEHLSDYATQVKLTCFARYALTRKKHSHNVVGTGWLAVALTVMVFVVCASTNRVAEASSKPSATTLTRRAFVIKLNIILIHS